MEQILFLLILCSVGLPGMVSAAETDPIRAGYLHFYQGDLRGDREGAVRLHRQIANDDDEKRAAVTARLGLVTPYMQGVSPGWIRREPEK